MKVIHNILLFPLSLIYGSIIWIRNKLYNLQILKSSSFNIPIISVGNLAVGGTGKTPHVEYLIRLFGKYQVKTTVLSRGYRRKTTGFLWADNNSTAEKIGDEPMQIKTKYPNVDVAVAENRVFGIQKIIKSEIHKTNDVKVIILDDAYQHRKITPRLSILLLEYKQLKFGDHLLPLGRLREPFNQKKRADIIIITKCPKDLSIAEQNKLKSKIGDVKKIFFTYINYGIFTSFLSTNKAILNPDHILLVTGIANPNPLIKHLQKLKISLKTLTFPDHHHYKIKDIIKIKNIFSQLSGTNKMILTTEKDLYRFKNDKLKEIISTIQKDIYYIPIEIEFLNNENRIFDEEILQLINN